MEKDLSLMELNSSLDDLSLKILSLMNDYIECKLKLEQTIKNGCLDLAKARYIRGSQTISALQLPTEDSNGVIALAKVMSVKESEDDALQFRLSHVEISDPLKESSLKCRTGLTNSSENSVEEIKKISNPLRWFGVLVPQNLKQAQSWFKSSIELAVDCTNIQSEIETRRQKFLNLSQLKKKLSEKQ